MNVENYETMSLKSEKSDFALITRFFPIFKITENTDKIVAIFFNFLIITAKTPSDMLNAKVLPFRN